MTRNGAPIKRGNDWNITKLPRTMVNMMKIEYDKIPNETLSNLLDYVRLVYKNIYYVTDDSFYVKQDGKIKGFVNVKDGNLCVHGKSIETTVLFFFDVCNDM